MKKVVIDTNAILRFILKDVPPQSKKVADLIKKAKGSKLLIIIPEVVVFEVYHSLRTYYSFSKEELIEVLESLLSAHYFQVENKFNFIECLKDYKLFNLSFADSFILAKVISQDLELFTFDKKLEKCAASLRVN